MRKKVKRREWKVKIEETLERKLRRKSVGMTVQHLLMSLLLAFDEGIVEVPMSTVPAAVARGKGQPCYDSDPPNQM